MLTFSPKYTKGEIRSEMFVDTPAFIRIGCSVPTDAITL